jgi:predicted transcriptional regulator
MLVECLKKKQTELGLTNRQFAQRLRVSQGLWEAARYGSRNVGKKLIKGVLTCFPELTPEVLEFLKGGR